MVQESYNQHLATVVADRAVVDGYIFKSEQSSKVGSLVAEADTLLFIQLDGMDQAGDQNKTVPTQQ